MKNLLKNKKIDFQKIFTPKKIIHGFTLIEVLVSTAVFLIISVAIYAGFVSILKTMNVIRIKGIMTNIANEQFEIARNLPYSNVGTVNGIPAGIIPQSQTITRDNKTFTIETVVRNIDDPFDGTFDGTPKDSSPADMKIMETTLSCLSCDVGVSPVSFTSKIAPKNLETASTNGAIVVKVFDSSGIPVPGANVNIINTTINPNVNLNDSTDINGILTIVDAPPSIDGYRITVSKDGYSTERTYKIGETANPNPIKTDLSVIVQQISQISFTIDKTSTINVSTVDNQCLSIPSFNFNIKGNKLVGTNPDVYKYNQNFVTNSLGEKTLSDIEWDTYMISGTDSVNDIIGTNPLLSLGVNPDVEQDLQIITAPKNGRRLLVVVRDQSTGLPVTDAEVNLVGPNDYSQTLTTSQGFKIQSDWSGGGGQENFDNKDMYFDSDKNIDDDTYPGNLRLKKGYDGYVSEGYLTSSTIDLGLSFNYKQIIWNSITQPKETGDNSVRVQIATNNDMVTWNFVGPDNTDSTFYTSADQNINQIHNGDRYIRYRIYLSTENSSHTPDISDISITYSSSCIPPGQVNFSGLLSGNYQIKISHHKYPDTYRELELVEDWRKEEIVISQ